MRKENNAIKWLNKIGVVVKKKAKEFNEDESGIGVVEMILILVVLIGLVVIFRDQLTTIIGNIFQRIATDSAGI